MGSNDRDRAEAQKTLPFGTVVGASARIRMDLRVTAVDAGGVRCYDVERADGVVRRFFENEWLLARRLDGTQTLEELALWARERLGAALSDDDLGQLMSRLEAAGFFEEQPAPAAVVPEPAPEPEPVPPAPKLVLATLDTVTADAALEDAAENLAPVEETLTAAAGGIPLVEPDAMIEEPQPPPRPAPSPLPKPDAARLAALAKSVKPPPPEAEPLEAFFHEKERREDAPPRRSGPSLSASILVTMGIVGATMALPLLVYATFVRPRPPATVRVDTAHARELLVLYAEPAVVEPLREQLAFLEQGTLQQVVSAGIEAQAHQQLATLADQAQVDAELTHVEHRRAYYEKQLADARQKDDEEAIARDEKKLDEKRRMIAELEARRTRMQLTAPRAGRVLAVLVQPGTSLAAGQAVLELGDNKLRAVFHAQLETTSVTDGDHVQLEAPSRQLVPGRLAKVDGDRVTVDIDPSTGLKAGDRVRLVRSHREHVVDVPGSALVERGGVSTVFVREGEMARARTVSVLDRDAALARVQSGLKEGDLVITDPRPTLQDGDPVK